MASAISSRVRKRLKPLSSLAAPVGCALERGPVPLLVLRLPQFERIAWRCGKRAAQRLERATIATFIDSASAMLRTGDCSAHDPGSDVFAIAMSAPSRQGRAPSAADIRAVIERVSAAIWLHCGLRAETGWTLLSRVNPSGGMEADIVLALERGARERERYEFFCAIGHELRTPLTSIRGYLETLLLDELDDATAHRFLETARREALRMGRLLEGMFEFSLLDLSGETFGAQACDVDAHVLQACEAVAPLAHTRGMTIETKLGTAACAAIDPDACLQLIVNLLDNAIKYGRDGGTVRVSVCVRDGEAVICVDDDGPGIASHERESIFGLRVRGAGSSARPGTGIGLAIVKMIAERAGGAVAVAQSPLGGARFEAALPLKEDSATLMS